MNDKLKALDGISVGFPFGIPGFETCFSFRFLVAGLAKPFMRMESNDDESVSFIVIDPNFIVKKYSVKLSDKDKRDLDVSSSDECIVAAIVAVGETVDKTTVNLMAPIVVNVKKGLAKQVIMADSGYPLTKPLLT